MAKVENWKFCSAHAQWEDSAMHSWMEFLSVLRHAGNCLGGTAFRGWVQCQQALRSAFAAHKEVAQLHLAAAGDALQPELKIACARFSGHCEKGLALPGAICSDTAVIAYPGTPMRGRIPL